ncbi:hypothetical protein L596_003197 [Steinernema carpocapsae]|uniref:Insulin-like domain-containing protein n=1 Tax=Steinernema carpocapsae TaxID=34508 RepID=A0A4U8UUP2_STECR|nr:hypothetical protein L596_003197 [Steinernema carpocapsae]
MRTVIASALFIVVALLTIVQPTSSERIPQTWSQPDTSAFNTNIEDLVPGSAFEEDGKSYAFPVMFQSKMKREILLDSVPRRVCGVKLVKTVVKICRGCVKSPGMVPVEHKRSDSIHSLTHKLLKRDPRESITRLCCANPCTIDLIKENFCC